MAKTLLKPASSFSPPSAVSATPIEYNQLKVSWTSPPGNQDGYEIDIKRAADSTWTLGRRILRDDLHDAYTGRTQGSVCRFAGLEAAQQYDVRMRSIRIDAGAIAESTYSATYQTTMPAYQAASSGAITVYTPADTAALLSVLTTGLARGDIIQLTTGVTYGPITLQAPTTGTGGYVTIRGSNVPSLPVWNERVSNDSHAAGMATLSNTTGTDPVITIPPGVDWYTFEGVRITYDFASSQRLVQLSNSLSAASSTETTTGLSYGVEFHRCCVDVESTNVTQDCFVMDGHQWVIKDCDIRRADDTAENHAVQFVVGCNTHTQNNRMWAQSTNYFIGGGQYGSIELNAKWATCHRNHIGRDSTAIEAPTSNYPGKNLCECKEGDGVFITENIMEYDNAQAQTEALVFYQTSQNAPSKSWVRLTNLFFERNICRYLPNAFQLSGSDPYIFNRAADSAENWVIRDNLFYGLGDGYPEAGVNLALQMYGDIPDSGTHDWYIEHNTFINKQNPTTGREAIYWLSCTKDWDSSGVQSCPIGGEGRGDLFTTPFYIRSNIFSGTGGPIMKWDCAALGYNIMETVFGTSLYDYTHNVYVDHLGKLSAGDEATYYPSTTCENCTAPDSWAAVGFEDEPNDDYRLSASSTYKNAGHDGADIGAPVATLNILTANVVSGDWTT